MLRKNIILIDDCTDYARVAKKKLERNGFHVTTFHNSPEAFEYVIQNHNSIDLLLLDLMMPELSGLEFLSTLNENRNRAKFKFKTCVLSDKHDQLEIETTFKLGASEYFLKSENIDIIVEKIYEFMEMAKKPTPDQSREFISLLEITNIIHDFQVVEYDENVVTLHSNEELPIHSTIQINSEKLKKYKQTNMPVNCIVDNCEILDERVLITCQYLDQVA